MKKRKIILSLLLLATSGLTSCNGIGGFLNSEEGNTASTTEEKKDDNKGNTQTTSETKENENVDKEETQKEDEKPTGEDEKPNPEPEPQINPADEFERKKNALLADKRILSSKGVGFTYLDYDLNEQYKSWTDLLNDKNVSLDNNKAIASIDTDSLGKGVLNIPEDVKGLTSSADVKNEMVDSVVIGGSSWTEQYTNLKKIGRNARKIKVKDGITQIIGNFFSDLSKLEEIELPSSIESLGWGTFTKCTSLKKVDISNTKITTIAHDLFLQCKSLEEVIFPNTVNGVIGDSSFRECTSLKTITIPGGIKGVGGRAFEGCTALPSLTLTSSVTTIPDYAFKDCTSCVFTINSQPTSIGKQAFENCEKPFSIDLSKVTSIAYQSFKNSGITNADLSSAYTQFNGIGGVETFNSAKNLTTVTLSSNVKNIDKDFFTGASKLTTVTTKGTINEVGEGAFKGCESLSNVDFFNKNENLIIRKNAFNNCGTLTSNGVLNLKAKQVHDYAFQNTKIKELNITNTTDWGDEIAGFIGWNHFQDCTELTKVTYSGVKSKGFPNSSGCFADCTKLKEVSFLFTDSAQVNSRSGTFFLERNIFENCPLEKITFSGTVDAWIKSTFPLSRMFVDSDAADSSMSVGYEAFDIRQGKLQVTCLNGCKTTNELGKSITLTKNNIINYINRVRVDTSN